MVRVIATSKQEGLKSYLGIISLVKISNQSATQSIACESLQPTTAIPPRPSNVGHDSGTQTCPDGYRNLGGQRLDQQFFVSKEQEFLYSLKWINNL